MVRSPQQRHTPQRAAVQQALAAQPGFSSAQDIHAALRKTGHRVGLATVYRHLRTYAEQGLADVIHTTDGEATYRFCGATDEQVHHHHLVCRTCGRVEEVEERAIEQWATTVARRYGFTDIDHTVEIFGLCPDCVE